MRECFIGRLGAGSYCSAHDYSMCFSVPWSGLRKEERLALNAQRWPTSGRRARKQRISHLLSVEMIIKAGSQRL